MPNTDDQIALALDQPAAANAGDLAPGFQVGEFVISQKIGQGGMASVYGALHPIIGKKAAVKVLAPRLSEDAAQVDRFIQEARAVNAIGHDNIVDVFAYGRLPDGRCYFIMEWLPGQNLDDVLFEQRLPLHATLDILDQTCVALEAAHRKGIIHRDLKPANVFLMPGRDSRYTVKLLDFGVAKLTTALDAPSAAFSDEKSQPNGLTAAGHVVGTPEYISPEQARGIAIEPSADVYSLGVMAYEMILGRRPFDGPSVMSVMESHVHDAPPPPREIWPEIPPALESLLLRLLAKKPSARPSLDEMRVEMHTLARQELPAVPGQAPGAVRERAGASMSAPTPAVLSISAPVVRWSNARSWGFAAAAALAVALAGVALPMARRRQPAPTVAMTSSASSASLSTLLPAERAPLMASLAMTPNPSPAPTAHKLSHSHKRLARHTPRDPDYLVNPFEAKR